jgi:hypothetical protein
MTPNEERKMIVSGRKVVEAVSLNVTDVSGPAVLMGLFSALLGPGILRETRAAPLLRTKAGRRLRTQNNSEPRLLFPV